MKKISFIKLNLQQKNILSKEERKKIIGGEHSGNTCYVRCDDSNVFVVGAQSCSQLQTVCNGGKPPTCCICGSSGC